MRINVSMDEELIRKIDEVASRMHVSRSAYISFAVSQKMQSDKVFDNLPELLQAVQAVESAVELEKAGAEQKSAGEI